MRSLRFYGNEFNNLNGAISFVHDDRDTHSCAYELGEVASIRIKLPRSLGVISVSATFMDESARDHICSVYGIWSDVLDGYDIYDFEISTSALGVGLYFFSFEILTQFGHLWGFKRGRTVYLSRHKDNNQHFQISISEFTYAKPEHKYGGII